MGRLLKIALYYTACTELVRTRSASTLKSAYKNTVANNYISQWRKEKWWQQCNCATLKAMMGIIELYDDSANEPRLALLCNATLSVFGVLLCNLWMPTWIPEFRSVWLRRISRSAEKAFSIRTIWLMYLTNAGLTSHKTSLVVGTGGFCATVAGFILLSGLQNNSLAPRITSCGLSRKHQSILSNECSL